VDLSALTIQQLRYLVAVDRHRSFREAADACHVSQPALSMQVKRVEELLGTSVFDRSRQPVLVTVRGAAVLEQARLAIEHFDRIGLVLDRGKELSGSFRLGVLPTLVATFVPPFLLRFAQAHPRVSLEIEELRTVQLVRALREGALDAGLAATPLGVPTIHERVVCHEALHAYLPPGHPLLARARVRQADLMDEHVWLLGDGHCFRSQVLHLCSVDRGRGTARSGRLDTSSFEALVGIVDSGFGVTVLPELVVRAMSPQRQAAQVRPFAVPEPVRTIGFVHAREHDRMDVAEALFRTLVAALPPDLVGRSPRSSSSLAPEVRAPLGPRPPARRRRAAAR
jgi:LysR family hydrogen peroxide-inducible transcriptional activator